MEINGNLERDIDAGSCNADVSEIDENDLGNIIDTATLLSLMEKFSSLTGIATAILDLKGNVIVATGWKHICTKFHRCNPQTAKFCTESDLFLAKNVQPGKYVAYKCRNNMWDGVTPLYIGNKYWGNIYAGQFFYDDEVIDESVFIAQAEQFGFDRSAYLTALRQVPRFSHDEIETLMAYLVELTSFVSRLSYSNAKLTKSVSAYRQAESELQRQYLFLQQLIDTIPSPVYFKNINGNYIGCNHAFADFIGVDKEKLIGKKLHEILPEEQSAFHGKKDSELFSSPGVQIYETRVLNHAGAERNVIFNKATFLNAEGAPDGLIGVIVDITEHRRAEAEREKLREELFQNQKMESVGRLAGGVAHDFNNMLQVILGYAGVALNQITSDHPLYRSLYQISAAAQRSSELTRQLLAFARKQTVVPVVLNLNNAVGSMLDMLRRLIGENIELVWKPGLCVWPVLIDPSQMDQILANLAANARDAIADTGILTIATENSVIDEMYCSKKTEAVPGEYVLLTVRDTGCGIPPENLGHLFEPFFTTKKIGHGTGLGLATVFGAVKQNNGFISVDSKPGAGTVFGIYLPRCLETAAAIKGKNERRPAGGDETVLLVEDEAPILDLGKTIIGKYGYTVLAASSPAAALEMAGKYDKPIHLLITDVVMPGMNGRQLSEQLSRMRPGLKSLYMSGYTSDVIAHHGVIDEGLQILQKPFSEHTLIAGIRDVLDR